MGLVLCNSGLCLHQTDSLAPQPRSLPTFLLVVDSSGSSRAGATPAASPSVSPFTQTQRPGQEHPRKMDFPSSHPPKKLQPVA